MTEDNFLAQLFKTLPSTPHELIVPPGDDAAVFAPNPQLKQVIAADQLIEGRHYLSSTSAQLCGRKLLARNLSDIAAMGAIPKYAILTCKLSETCTDEWLFDFHKGLLELAQEFNLHLIGGDLARGPGPSNFSLTITGEVDTAIQRSGAEDGDLLVATGEFGLSFETEHHLNFQPRVKEAQTLKPYAKAMIDITDGLLLDSKRLLSSASTQLDLVFDTPIIPKRQYQGKSASITQVLTNGEDYELVFALSPADFTTLQRNWPHKTKLTQIGHFKNGSQQILDSKSNSLESLMNQTYDHLRKS